MAKRKSKISRISLHSEVATLPAKEKVGKSIMQPDVLAEVLKQRGVAKVFYFHADHFEPWGSGLNEKTAKAAEHFAQQTRTSPYAAKLSLFYSTYVPHRLEFGGTDQPDARRASGDNVVFYQRSPQQDELATNAIRPLVADGLHEMHLHVHHEWWTRNDSHLDSPVSHWVNAHSTGPLDQQRLDLFFSLATAQIARETGAPFSRWGFVHGNWALAGSDRRICQIENELSMIMRHGGFGDFTFPAGRAICDPQIETPFTCRPLDLVRAYDLAEADPSPISHDTRIMQPDRFFIWNSKIKADYSSLDYYYPPNRDRFKKTDLMVDKWLKNSVVIGDCLFIKTHAHSMYNYYNMADPTSLIPHLYPDTVAVFDRLSKACDNAGVELRFVTVNEVMDVLHVIDGTAAPAPSHEPLAQGSDPAAAAPPVNVVQTAAPQQAEQPAPSEAGTKDASIAPPTSPSFERTIAAALRDRNQTALLADDDRLLPDGARAMFTYVRSKFASDSRHIVVAGRGSGALALLVAAAGFKVTAYETSASVMAASKSAIAALAPLLPSLQEKLQLIQGQYPDSFSVGAVADSQGRLLLATETTDTASANGLERMLGSLAIFDDVIVATAGENALLTQLGRAHEAIGTVWSSPANEIRHLRPLRVLVEATPVTASSEPHVATPQAEPPSRAGQPLRLDVSAFDAELVRMQRDWMNGEGRNFPADDGYALKVERNAILQAHELAIAATIAETYETASTDLFEIGSGCGALALLLARHGFQVLGFEGDRRRHPACQSNLAIQSQLYRGLDLRLRFVAGFFPEMFSLGLRRPDRKSVCIATNLTHSYTAKNQDLILRTASVFDEIILDLGRFGVNRDTQEERDRLLGGLLASYYEPVELIYRHEPYEYWRLRTRRANRPPVPTRVIVPATERPAAPAQPAAATAAAPTEPARHGRPTDLPVRDDEGLLFSAYGEQPVPACPVCGGSDTVGLWRIPMSRLDEPITIFGGSMSQLPTRQVPAIVFCYDFCKQCQAIYLNPVPSSAKERYRRDEYYIGKMAKLEEWRGYEELYDHFAPAIPADAKVMLDAASGIGQYLRIAQRRSPDKWQRLIGLDLSRAYVEDMREHGVDAHVFDLDSDDLREIAKPDSVDFVTFCEAFEHMEHPLQVLKKLLTALRAGGRLFFTAQRYGKDATGPVRPSEHFYIGQKFIDQLPARLGCRVVEVTTSNMRYYVTLEK